MDKQTIIAAINNQQIKDVFAILDTLDLKDAAYDNIRKEFFDGSKSIDFTDRLLSFVYGLPLSVFNPSQLQTPQPTTAEAKQIITQLISEGNLGEAIAILPDENDFILQKAQYNQLQRDYNAGLLDNADLRQQRARIIAAIQYFVAKAQNLTLKRLPSNFQTGTGDGNIISGTGTGNGTLINKNTATTTKILFLAANPKEEANLQSGFELKTIKKEMKLGDKSEAFEFLHPEMAVTATEITRAFTQNPDFIHFSGHGQQKGIIIAKDDNTAQLLPNMALKLLFSKLKHKPKLVFLNACYSAEQAKTISEFGIYVVGNSLPVDDNAAISFAKGFYVGISEGKTIEEAFNDGLFILYTEFETHANLRASRLRTDAQSENDVQLWLNGQIINV
jgi:hypothetical protein